MTTKPNDDEVVSIVLAIEEEVAKVYNENNNTLGVRGMAFLAKEAARVIRGCRPDLAFIERRKLND